MIEAYNLGSQVPNEEFIMKALELHADVLLVSQTVTQKDVHLSLIHIFTSLHIDSASFTQISEACGGDEKKIGEMILGIVCLLYTSRCV